MPSINMIAVRRADKRRQQQTIKKIIYTIAAEFGLAVVVISVMAGRLVATTGDLSDLSAKLAKLQPVVAQIQQMQAQTTEMQPIVATMDGARQDTLFWYNGFYAVTSALPSESWLTSASTNGGADGAGPGAVESTDPQISLSGIAQNQDTVGSAILRMNQLPGLDHVDLSTVSQQKTGTTNTVSFQMTVHLTPEQSAGSATAAGGATNVTNS